MPLISQGIRCGTSIGANYMEAGGTESKKDFKHKIAICKKECKEMKHWLRMIAKANSDKKEQCQTLARSARINFNFFCNFEKVILTLSHLIFI